MPTIKCEKTVPYSPQQMFDLVNKVEEYPQFVPYCRSVAIVSRNEEEIIVQLDFAKGSLHKSFTTRNRLQNGKMIQVRLVNGPFKHLEGFWQFEMALTGCHINLYMEFEFSNKWTAVLFGPFFNKMTTTLVEVFCQRAKQIYGMYGYH